LNAIGQKFYTDYAAKYGPTNEPYAVYGYDLMNGLLAAIENVCATGGDPLTDPNRDQGCFCPQRLPGCAWNWSIDQNGDISCRTS